MASSSLKLSIVYITKRPGSYDVLFNSILQQNYPLDYELICIDDALPLAKGRAEAVIDYANKKGVRLKALRAGKAKTSPDARFGYCNALNTGVLESTGDVILFLQDYCWLTKDVFRIINDLYQNPINRKVLLGFRERFFVCPPDKIDAVKFNDHRSLSIFTEELVRAPEDLGWPAKGLINPPDVDELAQDLKKHGAYKNPYVTFNFWECFCGAIPRALLVKLNGFDEALDHGDDCNETNVTDRASLLGYSIVVHAEVYVQQIAHQEWVENNVWKRFAKNSNLTKWGEMLNAIIEGKKPLPAVENNFDLKALARKSIKEKIARQGVARIAFVWDWDNEPSQLATWNDGLAAALNLLQRQKGIELRVYTQLKNLPCAATVFPHDNFPIMAFQDEPAMSGRIIADNPDFVLIWGDLTRPCIPLLTSLYPSGICYAGGQSTPHKCHLFDLMMVENESYKELYSSMMGHKNVRLAFGTNTTLFKPNPALPKTWDACFPASFIGWKRHNLYADACVELRKIRPEARFMACGTTYAHNMDAYNACIKAGIFATQYLPAYILPDFYNAARVVVITSHWTGGSQRTVLEAMACNVPVIAMEDSDKTSEYLIKAGLPECVCKPEPRAIADKMHEFISQNKQVNTREWVMNNYSEYKYADQMYRHIKGVLTA